MKITRWACCAAFFIGVISIFFGSQSASAANAWDFNPGNIMSDAVMRNYNSMDIGAIQNFLKSKNSCNDTRTYIASWYPTVYYHIENGHFICMADESFNGKSAAQIIYQAAQDYHINPQVLIVLLQKEQGLVTDTYPHNYQYRSATGYGCPDTSACYSRYYGFENQVRNAAALFDSVLNGGWTNYPIGWRYVRFSPNSWCGGETIYIENLTTSALYRYTPYQPNAAAKNAGYGTGDGCSTYGNRNFFLYFSDWFGSPHAATASAPDTFNIPVPTGDWQPMLIPRRMILSVNTSKYVPGTTDRSTNVVAGQVVEFSRKVEVVYQGRTHTCLQTKHDTLHDIKACIFIDELSEHPNVEFQPIDPIYRRMANNARKYIPSTSLTPYTIEKHSVVKFVAKITIDGKTYYRTEHDTIRDLYLGVYATNLSSNLFINFLYPRSLRAVRKATATNVITGKACSKTLTRGDTDYFTTKFYFGGKWYYRADAESRADQICVFSPDDLQEIN